MKKLARTLVLALAVSSAAGCAKASDLAAKQQETVAYAKSYDARLAELQERGKDFLARVAPLKQELGGAEAETAVAKASTIYRSMKALVDAVPNQIEAAVKSGKPDDLRKIATSLDVHTAPPNTQISPPTDMIVEMQRVMDNLNARLEDGYIESNANLDAVEAWLVRMEGRPGAEPEPVAHPAPTGQPADDKGEPDDKDDAPEGAGSGSAPAPGAGSGSGAGSAAPPAAGSGSAPRPAAPAAPAGPGSAAPR